MQVQVHERKEVKAGTKDLSVLILNYNVRDFLEQLLWSVKTALKGIDTEIIVIDNASVDGSVQMLKEKFPEVKSISNYQNVGFSRGFNTALESAVGKYVVLLNPDIVVQEDTFSEMIKFLDANPDVGMATCKVLNADGSLQLSCRRSFPSPTVAFGRMTGLSKAFPNSRIFGKYNMTYISENETHEVDAISGAFMFLRRDILEEVGPLDEQFYMYGEDLDWCHRIKGAGWKIYYVPSTQIIHYKGQSTRRSGFDDIQTFYESMQLFVQKHFSGRYSRLTLFLLKMAIRARLLISVSRRALGRGQAQILDLLVLNLALVLSSSIFSSASQSLTLDQMTWLQPEVHLWASLIWIGCLHYFKVYKNQRSSVSITALSAVTAFLITSTLILFIGDHGLSRWFVFVASGFMGAGLIGWRLVYLILKKKQSDTWLLATRLFKKNTLIVGDIRSASDLIDILSRDLAIEYDVKAIITNTKKSPKRHVNGVPVVGNTLDIVDSVVRLDIKNVIFCSASLSWKSILYLIGVIPKKYEVQYRTFHSDSHIVIGKSETESFYTPSLMNIASDYDLVRNVAIRRTIDVLFSALALLVLFVPVRLRCIYGAFKRKKYVLASHGVTKSGVTLFEDTQGKIIFYSLLKLALLGHLSLVGRKFRNDGEPFEILHQDEDVVWNLVNRYKYGIFSITDVLGTGEDQQSRPAFDLYYLREYSIRLDLEILARSLLRIRT